jgi:hypothetical protein
MRRNVLAAARGRCAFCRSEEKLMGVTFEIDHIVPRLRRGKTSPGNLCLCCPSCNRHKAARTQAVDHTTGAETSLFHPRHDRWSEHFVWSNDGTRVLGLTPTGRATIDALKMNRPQMIELRRYWLANGNHPRNAEEE